MWASLSKLKHIGQTKSLSLSSKVGATPDKSGVTDPYPCGQDLLRLLPFPDAIFFFVFSRQIDIELVAENGRKCYGSINK